MPPHGRGSGIDSPSPLATEFVPTKPAPREKSQRAVHLPPADIPCRYFQAGYCSRGTRCWYKHEPREEKLAAGRVVTKKDMDASEKQKEPCAICFETPDMYGLMMDCDHVFCLTCIRSWRSTMTDSSTATPNDAYDPAALRATSKTCPLCRVKTKYIVPSVTFPPDEETKAMIVSVYRKRLAKLPCRYFTASLTRQRQNSGEHSRAPKPECPFGNDCFYRHTVNDKPFTFSETELARMKWVQRTEARRRREGDTRRRPWWTPDWYDYIDLVGGDGSEYSDVDDDDYDDDDDDGNDLDDIDFEDDGDEVWEDHEHLFHGFNGIEIDHEHVQAIEAIIATGMNTNNNNDSNNSGGHQNRRRP